MNNVRRFESGKEKKWRKKRDLWLNSNEDPTVLWSDKKIRVSSVVTSAHRDNCDLYATSPSSRIEIFEKRIIIKNKIKIKISLRARLLLRALVCACDLTIDIERKNRLLKVCYVPPTSTTFLAFFAVAIYSTYKANKAGRYVPLSSLYYLDVYGFNSQAWFKIWMGARVATLQSTGVP